VTFNVGGQHFEVLRSTVARFPSALLQQLTEDLDMDDEKPIYVEANRTRFEYILDFYRYGKVRIPCTVPKEAMWADVNFFLLPVKEEDIEVSVDQAIPGGIVAKDMAVKKFTKGVDTAYFSVLANSLMLHVMRQFSPSLTFGLEELEESLPKDKFEAVKKIWPYIVKPAHCLMDIEVSCPSDPRPCERESMVLSFIEALDELCKPYDLEWQLTCFSPSVVGEYRPTRQNNRAYLYKVKKTEERTFTFTVKPQEWASKLEGASKASEAGKV